MVYYSYYEIKNKFKKGTINLTALYFIINILE